jgi:hypothetical protein
LSGFFDSASTRYTGGVTRKKEIRTSKKDSSYPIKHWSFSSLLSYLRNPLAWHKRYVEGVYDTPSTPASFIGRAGHLALEHFYNGIEKEAAVQIGLTYLRMVPDFEIEFGKNQTKAAQKKKRLSMEKDYLTAIGYYLERPPKHKVLGVEVRAMAQIKGLPLPIKAISDLVVSSKGNPGAVDIVDHKFVNAFSAFGDDKPLFILQAIFNYYTVLATFKMPVKRFIVYECKKSKNKDGKSQMRRYVLEYKEHEDDFALFHRLLRDATKEITRTRVFLPNPSDMFEGKNSFEVYRMELTED